MYQGGGMCDLLLHIFCTSLLEVELHFDLSSYLLIYVYYQNSPFFLNTVHYPSFHCLYSTLCFISLFALISLTHIYLITHLSFPASLYQHYALKLKLIPTHTATPILIRFMTQQYLANSVLMQYMYFGLVYRLSRLCDWGNIKVYFVNALWFTQIHQLIRLITFSSLLNINHHLKTVQDAIIKQTHKTGILFWRQYWTNQELHFLFNKFCHVLSSSCDRGTQGFGTYTLRYVQFFFPHTCSTHY